MYFCKHCTSYWKKKKKKEKIDYQKFFLYSKYKFSVDCLKLQPSVCKSIDFLCKLCNLFMFLFVFLYRMILSWSSSLHCACHLLNHPSEDPLSELASITSEKQTIHISALICSWKTGLRLFLSDCHHVSDLFHAKNATFFQLLSYALCQFFFKDSKNRHISVLFRMILLSTIEFCNRTLKLRVERKRVALNSLNGNIWSLRLSPFVFFIF